MFTLGLDYGTTKCAVVAYDPENPAAFLAKSAAHLAEIPQTSENGRSEQDMNKVWECFRKLLAEIPQDIRQQVNGIGFTGQMHSVVCWNDRETSSVVTWQDKRASASGHLQEYLEGTNLPLADGFGGVTLAEMAREGTLSKWTHTASPVSWLMARMAGNPAALKMEPTFAASWGIWNPATQSWRREALDALHVPFSILPELVSTGCATGCTKGLEGFRDGIPLFSPIGDNQASVLGSAADASREVFLTIGTGAQLSIVLTSAEAASFSFPSTVEIRPFLGNRVLAVNAPLCGGRAWAWLGKSVNSFLQALGMPALENADILGRLDKLACSQETSSLTVEPAFLGQRGNAELRGSITGMDLDNFTLPSLARALCAGIIRQLVQPFPASLLARRSCIVGSGNGVRLCQAIQQEICSQSGLQLELREQKEEAALGAAKLAADSLEK